MAEELFDGAEFRSGHVEVLLGGLGVLTLHCGLRLSEIVLHAGFSGYDIAAEPVASGRLFVFERVERLADRCGAAVHVVVALLVLLDEGGVF